MTFNSRKHRTRRLLLDILEDRTTPTTFTVDTTADSGVGSLRQAILNANDTKVSPGLDTINFSIPGVGVQTIIPLTALPTISDPIFINGYSQPGASANTLAVGNDAKLFIELSGGPFGAGLIITAGNSTVSGLVINRFTNASFNPGNGIRLMSGGNNTIVGNFIGTNAAGDTATGFNSSHSGISIENSTPGNQIGGTTPAARNVILGNGGLGAIAADSPAIPSRAITSAAMPPAQSPWVRPVSG